MPQIPLIIEADPDDPDCAAVMVDGTVAGRPYRFILDTGAARTQLEADEYTSTLEVVRDGSGSGVFASQSDPVVTVTDVTVGPLRVATLDVGRVSPGRPHLRNLLGMDVLRRCRCLFRLESAVLDVEAPAGYAGRDLRTDSLGHIYVDVRWPGVTARACWDTGAGITVVNRDFWRANPHLFQEIGTTTGTDATGATLETPLVLLTQAVIGGRLFGTHKAAVVDLSHPNSTVELPMDMILGYPALRQADWLFDFPASRWTVMDPAHWSGFELLPAPLPRNSRASRCGSRSGRD
ncbi:MAG TPA: aspartyl protease family protein [Streptosporangiaceae bacterium]|nr:aspartyl protease family protein [Streptosporangiaceae bacterium]